MSASAWWLVALLLAFSSVRCALEARRTPPPALPPAPPPPPPPAARCYADVEADAVTPMEFWLCPQELATARREILLGELADLVLFVGGPTGDLRNLSALRLPPETLAAMAVVLAADPRIERVRLSDAKDSRLVITAVRDLLEASR